MGCKQCDKYAWNVEFEGAAAFNQPIGNWDVRSVTNMKKMFHSASIFNQPIGNWDISNVTRLDEMFVNAENFNQPLAKWFGMFLECN